ncbi:hypothetical protein EVAR_59270_1 [Eumeta japonica]|uniref:Uncharacterized protein n=1 Tax=Eumeta variegata TaxID=151549 RepID=A0A4C1YML0_EUMVA|nr:hypothetical protein EVAR_59270_1 [Eumeta japonica]
MRGAVWTAANNYNCRERLNGLINYNLPASICRRVNLFSRSIAVLLLDAPRPGTRRQRRAGGGDGTQDSPAFGGILSDGHERSAPELI